MSSSPPSRSAWRKSSPTSSGTRRRPVRYLHSDVDDTLKRVELLTELRQGVYDVLVGINLLREGLDLPEVSLVAILDADKEGFLRSSTSLIQTIAVLPATSRARCSCTRTR